MANLDAPSLILGWIIGVVTPFIIAWLMLGLNRMVQEANRVRNDSEKPGVPGQGPH